MKRLEIGCKNIDSALSGGIEPGILTEIYGEGGSGKSTLCMLLARNGIKSDFGKVAFIDTECISIERLTQICGSEFDQISREILFFEPYSLNEQEEYIDKALRMVMEGEVKIGMIILDSATVFYRLTLGSEKELAGRRSLSEQVIKLMALARKKSIYVVITSQVYTDIDSNEFLPLGGHVLSHNAKAILKLKRYTKNLRSLSIMKHRSIEQKNELFFRLTDEGMSPEDSPDDIQSEKNNIDKM